MALPIMAIKRDLLFLNDEFQGFQPANGVNFEERILKSHEFIVRGDAEQDLSYKQPICHIAIVNKSREQVFAFQRTSKSTEYTEQRLLGKWSLGVGGHIDKGDEVNGNPLLGALHREIAEEIEIVHASEPLLCGYINNDSVEVDRYHFGVFYIIEAEDARHTESSIAQGAMVSFSEIENICADSENAMEYWSIIMIGPLRVYFSRN